MSARVIQVIEVEEREGRGLDESDPIRRVMRYYSFVGVLLAERDEWKEQQEQERREVKQ